MKKVVLIVTAIALTAGFSPAFAAREGEKGADQSAYEHASDNAVFNRVGDWFATVGKSEEEKAKILEERKTRRAARRAAKRAEKEARKTEPGVVGKAERLRKQEEERSRKIDQEMEQQSRGKAGKRGGLKGGKGK